MNIRNFVIISHIDHGKSTLADRFLELTGTIPKHRMKPQYLDQLELERERGITIKMAPVRMRYAHSTRINADINADLHGYINENQRNNRRESAQIEYILNLIDTPGHSDFSYEVSRALSAVEGAILLVDATKGIQAQTLANFEAAKKVGLKIIGAVNKIDIALSEQIEDSVNELSHLLDVSLGEIFRVSAKTGEGVSDLLEAIIDKIPSPISVNQRNNQQKSAMPSRVLIFDSFYDEHKGVIVAVRVFNGELKSAQEIFFIVSEQKTKIKEIGHFLPELKTTEKLSAGEIGYLVTGLKDPDKIKIGDTIINLKSQTSNLKSFVLPGYQEPPPVVFVSFYPEDSNQYEDLKKAFQKLKLNDSSLKIEADFNEALGRGFKIGFLGKLHFEITAERLEREFSIKTVNSFPSVSYKVRTRIDTNMNTNRHEYITIENPKDLPDGFEEIWEPMIKLEIITPTSYLGNILQFKDIYRWEKIETKNLDEKGEKILISAKMPLAELISDFDDRLKSISAGFASYSYEFIDFGKADLVKLEILVAYKPVPGLIRILPGKRIVSEGRRMTERLKTLLPQQQFSQAIQAVSDGRVIARETIPALKKDVTGYLYGGDRTRKMKLWQKQKKGKKKLLQMAGEIKIPVKVFKNLLK